MIRELTTQWILPTNISSQLECHYILYWEYQHFKTQVIQNAGEIIRHGIHYTVIPLVPHESWHNCSRVSLSFRKEKNHDQGFVLVQCVSGAKERAIESRT